MRVRDLMRPIPRYCTLKEPVLEAGRIMAETGVGALPVLDDARRVVGMITDRDICCAVSLGSGPLAEMTVSEVASTPARICHPDENVSSALTTMRAYGVRRLPVTDPAGRLEGVLSLDEVILAAHSITYGPLGGPVHGEVVETLQAILRPATSLVETAAGRS